MKGSKKMMVTAKATLVEKKETLSGVYLMFGANYDNGKNQEWAHATPSLNFTMTVKKSVGDMFTVGKHYTVSFTEDEVHHVPSPETPAPAGQ